MKGKIDISFIILAWNSERYLDKCVNSINESLISGGFCYEILILDNGSNDNTPQILRYLSNKQPDIVIPHYETENIGTTRSRNYLFSLALGNYICVMDSDAELRSGVLEALTREIEKDSNIGLVVPCIFYPSGAWQKSFDNFPTFLSKINRFFWLRFIEKQGFFDFKKNKEPFYVDYAISAFWLFNRNILSKVGMLDERIFYSPEDVDFCLRIWKAGYRILYVPSVSIIHDAQEISRGFRINQVKLSHLKGLAYYFIKHRYLLRRPNFDLKFKKNFP